MSFVKKWEIKVLIVLSQITKYAKITFKINSHFPETSTDFPLSRSGSAAYAHPVPSHLPHRFLLRHQNQKP